MKNMMFLLALCLSVCFPKEATTDAETVWLRDLTKRLQTDTRGVTGPDLPDKLSFHLKSRTHSLVLNLNRNYQIDPNTDIYILKKLKDGRSVLEMKQLLEKADVAYYQDMENGAFMTARCVKRSSEQCDITIMVCKIDAMARNKYCVPNCFRIMKQYCKRDPPFPNDEITNEDRLYLLRALRDYIANLRIIDNFTKTRSRTMFGDGNIRLGDRNYNLRPSEAEVIQNDFLEIIGLRGRRYVLQDQANIQSGMSVENNEQTNVVEKNVQEKYLDALRHNSYGQEERNPYMKPEDKTRNRNNYYVDVIAAADSSLWELFFAIARTALPHQRVDQTHRYIREYLLHIVNGVDQLYNGIEDSSISIRVRIRAFVTWPLVGDFTHFNSTVQHTASGTTIEGDKYLQDLKFWDINIGLRDLPPYDQVILFTKHILQFRNPAVTYDEGLSIHSGVCDVGRRVQIVRVEDFFTTTRSTAHGLGHSLGALHDGDDAVTPCRANDKYIMSPIKPMFYPSKKPTPNPWKFSGCSVEAFKRSLVNKRCLNAKFVHDLDIQEEMHEILRLQPGQRYSANEQCVIKNGILSTYKGKNPSIICVGMICSYPANGKWDMINVAAAPGTGCGDNKYCQKGLCVNVPQQRFGAHNPLRQLSNVDTSLVN